MKLLGKAAKPVRPLKAVRPVVVWASSLDKLFYQPNDDQSDRFERSDRFGRLQA
jgi:hypothetical protein